MAARFLLGFQANLRLSCFSAQRLCIRPANHQCYCTAAATKSSPKSTASQPEQSQSSPTPSTSSSSSSSSSSTTSSSTASPSSSQSSSSSPSKQDASSPSLVESAAAAAAAASSTRKDVAAATPRMNPVLDVASTKDEDGFKERFIPLARRSLIRQLIQEEDFLTEAERRRLEEFAVALDTAISKQYHGVLAELKQLFDPLNPDKDTVGSRLFGKQEKADSEFWLMQKLSALLESANFHELPSHVVKRALDEHLSGEGVNVSVNPKNYEILRFWALGKELPRDTTPWYKRMSKSVFYRASKRTPPAPVRYYKRILVAVKPKGQDKLMLKMFKEIPTGALEQLLPDGKIKMSGFDNGLMTFTVAAGSLSILIKAIAFLADYNAQWSMIVTAAAGIVGLQAWNSYKNRRTRYMMRLSSTLYYKNIANNRGLLALLVDRAQDESFKEALLTYTFLLANRPTTVLDAANRDPTTLPPLLGGISSSKLDQTIERWFQERTGSAVTFNSRTARSILESYGILFADEDTSDLAVLPLDAAIVSLPRQPASMATRTEEAELEEGYDKIFKEEESTYKKEEKTQRRHGWS